MKSACYYFAGCALMMLMVLPCLTKAQDKQEKKEWNVPEKEAAKKSEIKSDDDAIKAGKDIWSKHCKSCHGAKGLGDGPKAAKIDISCGDFSSDKTQDLSDGALYWKLTEGKDPMPGFKKKLTDIERWQLVAFIRTLGKKGNSPSASNQNVKNDNSREKEKKDAGKDSTASHVNLGNTNPESNPKTDSLKTHNPEYVELKNEIEKLRMDFKIIGSKVDSLMMLMQKK
jgi:mono/diheme cytochrome c family protein